MRTIAPAIGRYLLALVIICLAVNLHAQDGSPRARIRGIVRDSTGAAVPSAAVTVLQARSGFSAGARTDSAGVFSFAGLAPDSGYSIRVTHVGYGDAVESGINLQPGAEYSLVLRLSSIIGALDEVVVVGYGTQRKTELTSAVASVKAKDFVKGAVNDASQLIRGKVAGLTVVTPDANPTSTAQILLRGTGSIYGAANPLIIIDGVPGNLNTVAPEDIEQVDVLKDGSAAAIYGTRASGGGNRSHIS